MPHLKKKTNPYNHVFLFETKRRQVVTDESTLLQNRLFGRRSKWKQSIKLCVKLSHISHWSILRSKLLRFNKQKIFHI